MSFRECFHRKATFRWFVILVIAFILRDDHLGVTSVIRTFVLDAPKYYGALHFFHSTAWATETLRQKWYRIVFESGKAVKVNGKTILAGDGVKQSKEGRRMPGVKKLHQESEDQSKAEYIFGHLFGAIGVLVGTAAHTLCLPLKINIQDGLQEAASWENSSISSASHVVQMIENGYNAAKTFGDSILLLDRYFLTVPGLRKMQVLNASEAGHHLEMVTKAKVNCIAYLEPEPRKPGKQGRPRKKGDAVKLASLFQNDSDFQETSVTIYGNSCSVKYKAMDLLWGKGMYQKMRFVLVIFEGQQSILVSTDLQLKPEQIIELYALRFKIESCFREFKQQIGGFCYHFWSKGISRLNRYKKKEEPSNLALVKGSQERQWVLGTIEATERFVQVACIAMGLIQLMLFHDETDVQAIQDFRYTRTKTPGAISEATMMYYLRRTFLILLAAAPESELMQLIREAKSAG